MTQNICIVGFASEMLYTQAMASYTWLDDTVAYVIPEGQNPELVEAMKALGITLKLLDDTKDMEKIHLHRIICFTDYVGIDIVSMLTQANEQGTDIIFIHPTKSELTKEPYGEV